MAFPHSARSLSFSWDLREAHLHHPNLAFRPKAPAYSSWSSGGTGGTSTLAWHQNVKMPWLCRTFLQNMTRCATLHYLRMPLEGCIGWTGCTGWTGWTGVDAGLRLVAVGLVGWWKQPESHELSVELWHHRAGSTDSTGRGCLKVKLQRLPFVLDSLGLRPSRAPRDIDTCRHSRREQVTTAPDSLGPRQSPRLHLHLVRNCLRHGSRSQLSPT